MAARAKMKGSSRSSKPRLSADKPRPSAKTAAGIKRRASSKRAKDNSGSRSIDERIPSTRGWQAKTLAQVRRILRDADPDIVEERKWVKPSNPLGVPVWSHAGIVCTGETYQQVVKLTFARGASLPDPRRLFNSSLEGNTRRAIDIREGDVLDVKGLKELIQAAVAANLRANTGKSKPASAKSASAQFSAGSAKPVKLLSGGNPQIAMADGDAPVQAYIAAMPGWKRDVGKRIDSLIVRAVPHVRKAVKWNSPFYGIEGQGYFLSIHVFTRYVKVAFFQGASLRPLPPGGTPKSKDSRWIDIYEDDHLDVAQLTAWVKQAAALPGFLSK